MHDGGIIVLLPADWVRIARASLTLCESAYINWFSWPPKMLVEEWNKCNSPFQNHRCVWINKRKEIKRKQQTYCSFQPWSIRQKNWFQRTVETSCATISQTGGSRHIPDWPQHKSIAAIPWLSQKQPTPLLASSAAKHIPNSAANLHTHPVKFNQIAQ